MADLKTFRLDTWEGLRVDHDNEPQGLARKIDRLFKAVHKGEREHSAEEVATGLREMGGPTISSTYIWQLRTGKRDNPTKKHLEALAAYFRVPVAYFFDDEAAERIDAELDLLVAMRDSGVRSIALRTVGFDAQSLDAVRSVVDQLRALQKLPPVAAASDEPAAE